MSNFLFDPTDQNHSVPTLLNLLYRPLGSLIFTATDPNLHLSYLYFVHRYGTNSYETCNTHTPWQRIGPKKRKYSTLPELLDEIALRYTAQEIQELKQRAVNSLALYPKDHHDLKTTLYLCFLLEYATAHHLSYSRLYNQLSTPFNLPNPPALNGPPHSITTVHLVDEWSAAHRSPRLYLQIKNDQLAVPLRGIPVSVKVEATSQLPTLGTLILNQPTDCDLETAKLYDQILPWLQQELQQKTFHLSPNLQTALKIAIPA